ncbi:MAG: fumarylacetoacetate hydrolase family protein, partial [Flavobacteriales bacterium]
MKLIRFGDVGKENPGIQLENGTKIDVSHFGEDYNEVFFETNGIERLKNWLKDNASKCPSISEETRLGSPICRPSKLVCIGLNYAQHAAEAGMKIPSEPVLFFKSTTAIVGPYDDVIIPRG